MYRNIVFVDFDGTITTEDTLVGAIYPFVDPEEFREYNGRLEKGEMTLSEVVRYAYDGRPAKWLPKMLEYIDTVEIRPGFDEFLDKMEEADIPVVVISGGVSQFSQRKLKPYENKLKALHAVQLSVENDEMHLISQYDDGNELLKKTDVMALYEYEHAIGIGDSFTDMNMAQAVDTVFARDILAKYLDKLGKPYIPYDDFFDVIKAIEEKLD
ncbi:MAG: HAD-IB family phosphatase [Anaerovoracaceae bacterium]